MSATRRTLRNALTAAVSTVAIAGLMSPAIAHAAPGSADLFGSLSSAPAGTESAAPKNIIYMIGDGMGYNHVAAANLYEAGRSSHQVEGTAGEVSALGGEAVQSYEGEGWNRLAMPPFQHDNSYDPERAWADHDYVNEDYTDSAAAGTAMATGIKTINGKLGVGPANEILENTSERAKAVGKAAGVVSDVPFNHATPAAWAGHNESRNAYEALAAEMIDGDLDVIMGAGHPFFNDDNERIDQPNYRYIGQDEYERLIEGDTDFVFFDNDEQFRSLAEGNVEAERYFGLAQVASTLQQSRSGEGEVPYSDPHNDVVDLATMSQAALNVLDQDEDGFHLMIEAGAIDWAGHANDIARDIEEVQSLNSAVDAVVDWGETTSSWEETLLIVTADHETGYLSGQDELPGWRALTGEAGEVPAHDYYSGNHTNMLVPFFFRGAGSEDLLAATTGTDPVRGDYLDNITAANLTLDNWWARD